MRNGRSWRSHSHPDLPEGLWGNGATGRSVRSKWRRCFRITNRQDTKFVDLFSSKLPLPSADTISSAHTRPRPQALGQDKVASPE